MAPILRRNAEKIAAAIPELEGEFAAMSDEVLATIAAEDLDDYVRDVLHEDPDPR